MNASQMLYETNRNWTEFQRIKLLWAPCYIPYVQIVCEQKETSRIIFWSEKIHPFFFAVVVLIRFILCYPLNVRSPVCEGKKYTEKCNKKGEWCFLFNSIFFSTFVLFAIFSVVKIVEREEKKLQYKVIFIFLYSSTLFVCNWT